MPPEVCNNFSSRVRTIPNRLFFFFKKKGSLHWIQSDILPPYISDSDGTLLRDKYERFVNLTKGAGPFSWQDILLRLDTNEVREQPFKVSSLLTPFRFVSFRFL